MPRERRYRSLKSELVAKSREAALSAVQTFNNPLIRFKSETFIVLMVIAWTYLLHAYYRSKGIEYRYFQQGPNRRKFDRTKGGAFKYWELERCLSDKSCPLDRDTKNNLRFLTGLRHEIEHQMTQRLDEFLSARYQACSLNYNHYAKELFGVENGIDKYLTYSLQFIDLSYEQLSKPSTEVIPARIKAFVTSFDSGLSEEEFHSDRYAYRLLFKKKVVGKPGQADKVVEFIDANSDLAKTIDRELWVKKEVERPKFLPSQIVREMKGAGFIRFGMHQHTELWKSEDAKANGKGYGVMIGNSWYWYERWRDRVRKHCAENSDDYR